MSSSSSTGRLPARSPRSAASSPQRRTDRPRGSCPFGGRAGREPGCRTEGRQLARAAGVPAVGGARGGRTRAARARRGGGGGGDPAGRRAPEGGAGGGGGPLMERLPRARPDVAFVAMHGRDGED